MEGKSILVRIDGDRSDSELVGATKNSSRNFASIGGEQFFDGLHKGECRGIAVNKHVKAGTA